MTTTVPFDHNDYVKLAELLNSTADILSKRFQTNKITHFRVVDLKEIVRYMRTLKKFDNNPWLKHAAARKTQLIQNLRNAFLYHSNPNAAGLAPIPSSVGDVPMNHSSALQHAAAAHSSIHNLSSSTARNASAYGGHGHGHGQSYGANHSSSVQHAPHAHSNSAAMYASSYAHASIPSSSVNNNNNNSNSNNHNNGPHHQSSSYYPSSSSSSSRVNHTVSGSSPSTTYGNGHHSGHGHITGVTNTSSSSHDPDFVDVDRLIALPEFNSGRDPFHKVERMVARRAITPNKTAAIQFNLTPDIVSRLKGAPAMSRQYPASLTPDLIIHLRLFSQDGRQHHQWDRNFNVSVNSNWIKIPEPKKPVKSKKKGIEVIRPLDISAHIQLNNMVEVIFLRNAFAAESFRGVAVVEVVRERETSELLSLVGKKGEVPPQVLPSAMIASQAAAHAATLPEVPSKHCGLCSSTKDLLRCSRCKSEWYCGEQHQRDHWPTHRKVCYVPTPEQEMKIREREAAVAQAQQLHAQMMAANAAAANNGVKTENKDDELEVEEVDALVSLRCPLSIDRIVTPAKGRLCSHRRCFDLETFLMFSGQSGTWQCPICYGPLPFEDIVIDTALIKILKETDDEISQVRIMPDGTFQTIAPLPEDGDHDDDDDQDNKKKRLRRNDDNNPTTGAPAAAVSPSVASSSSSASSNSNGMVNNGVTARQPVTSNNTNNNGNNNSRIVTGVSSMSHTSNPNPIVSPTPPTAAIAGSSLSSANGNQRKRKHDSPVPSIPSASSSLAATAVSSSNSRAVISPAVATPVAGPGATADDAIVID